MIERAETLHTALSRHNKYVYRIVQYLDISKEADAAHEHEIDSPGARRRRGD